MRLTERDEHIMWRLHLCGWLSTTQIKREFFKKTTHRAVQKRLKILANEGLLFCKRPARTEEYYFRLGSKARFALAERFEVSSENIHTVRNLPVQLKHFSMLNDIRWHCETSIWHANGNLKFFLVDKELKGKLQNSTIIPDALFGFTIQRNGVAYHYIAAIEYDAGTENPQYFGRHKVKKYSNERIAGNPIFSDQSFRVLVFADSRRRVLQLIKHSLKFLHKKVLFFFASIEDLADQGDLFAPIFISPEKALVNDDELFCSAFEELFVQGVRSSEQFIMS